MRRSGRALAAALHSARNVQALRMLRQPVSSQNPVQAFTAVTCQGRRPINGEGRDHHLDVCGEARRACWSRCRHGSEAALRRQRYVRGEREARERWRAGRARRVPTGYQASQSAGALRRLLSTPNHAVLGAALSSGTASASQPAALVVPPDRTCSRLQARKLGSCRATGLLWSTGRSASTCTRWRGRSPTACRARSR